MRLIVLGLTLLTLLISGCSKSKSLRQYYQDTQMEKAEACHKHIDTHAQQRCREDANVHYDEYQTRLAIDKMRREGIIH